jgi:membrane-associated phospholipid phosphatase
VTPPVAGPKAWWPDALLLAGFAGLTLAVAAGWPLRLDVAVAHWMDAHRPAVLGVPARFLNYGGAGVLLAGGTALVALLLAVRRRSLAPLILVLFAFALTFGSLTALKLLTDRAAPHVPVPDPERFGSGGASYPSGHLVNSIVWYGVLALLLTPWLNPLAQRVLRLAPPVLFTVTTIYLGYHWPTDTVAGMLLGVFLVRVVYRAAVAGPVPAR